MFSSFTGKIILLACALIGASGATLAYHGYAPPVFVNLMHGRLGTEARSYTVEVNENGFTPARFTISRGDTVVFKNVSNVGVWPASDPHPTHEYLNGFDPKRALSPGESWNFTFAETGNWRYHDHVHVTSRGEINVLGTGVRKLTAGGTCDGQCFDELIRTTVATKGIDAAYKLFQDTYEAGQLPRACHWTAHQIGEAAYRLYKDGKDFPISLSTSYCGYGFYHGFMESLLRENPDPKEALKFCDRVKEKLGTMGLWNCYHGIGHGYTEDPPPPETIGNFDAMIAPGIKMCEFLFGKDFGNLNLCLTGVFTVPAGFAADGKYGLSLDPKHPFAYCKDQPYRYWKACYGEFAPKLEAFLGGDIHALPKYVNVLPDPKLQRLVTWVVPSVMMARDIQKPDNSNYITGCRDSFTGQLRKICWGGAILGFFSQGEPQKQYEKVITFCNSNVWQSNDERTFCWGEGFREMHRNYTTDKVQSICPMAPAQFQPLCMDPNGTFKSPYDDPSFDEAK